MGKVYPFRSPFADDNCKPNTRRLPVESAGDPEPLELPPTPFNWRALGLAIALFVVVVVGAYAVRAAAGF